MVFDPAAFSAEPKRRSSGGRSSKPTFDLASVMGKLPTGSSTSRSGSSGLDALSRAVSAGSGSPAAMGAVRTVRGGKLDPISAKALRGDYGAAQARSAYKRIMGSDAPKSVKKKVQDFYENGGESAHHDSSFWHKITHNPLTDLVGQGMMLIDKPKRAVVAAIDESNQALFDSGHVDKGSWFDHVFKDKSYGFGDAVAHAVAIDKANGSTTPLDSFASSKWGGRALGLGGDIATDPLSYISGGVTEIPRAAEAEAAGLTAEAAGKLSERELLDAADEAIKGSELTSKKLRHVGRNEVAQRLIEAGLGEKGAAVARRGASQATADELAQVGLEGGLRIGSKHIPGLGHDVTRLAGLPLGKVQELLRSSTVGSEVSAKFGDSFLSELRKTARDPKATPDEVASALTAARKWKSTRLIGQQLEHKYSAQLSDILGAAKKAGVDGEEIRAALTDRGSEAAAKLDAAVPNATAKLSKWLEDFRVSANNVGGEGLDIKHVEDYFPRQLTDEARLRLEQSGARSGVKGRGSMELTRLKAGDELMGHVLGEDAAHMGSTVDDQINNILQSNLGLDGPWHQQDAYVALPQYIKSVSKRAREEAFLHELKQSGVFDRAALGHHLEQQQALAGVVPPESPQIAQEAAGAVPAPPGPIAPSDPLRTASEAMAGPDAADPAINQISTGAKIAKDPETAVAHIDSQTQQIETQLQHATGDNAARLQHAHDQLTTAKEITASIGGVEDPAMRQALGLQSAAAQLEAQAAIANAKIVNTEMVLNAIRGGTGAQAFQDILGHGMETLGREGLLEAPPNMLLALEKVATVRKDPNTLLRYLDKANRAFKTYAILSPGFHVRNGMGGGFMNMVGDVDVISHFQMSTALRDFDKGGLALVSDKMRPYIAMLEESGMLHDGNRISAEAADFATGEGGRVHIGSSGIIEPGDTRMARASKTLGGRVGLTDNPVTRASRFAGDRVERFFRSTMAFDTLKKGGSLDDAIEKVYQFHFDYQDLSEFEKNTARRIIPFWTWTSRNMPLQLEQLARNPRMYARFGELKDELSRGNTDDSLTPGFIKDPITAINMGKDNYLSLNLPFENVDTTLKTFGENPLAGALENAAPVIKTPLEMAFGKQVFGGIPLSDKLSSVPSAWARIPGLMPLLQTTGVVTTDRHGHQMISGTHAYAVEQALPIMGRLRRMFPSKKDSGGKYYERHDAAILSFFGIGARHVSERDQGNEIFRRADALKALSSRLTEQDYTMGTTAKHPPKVKTAAQKRAAAKKKAARALRTVQPYEYQGT